MKRYNCYRDGLPRMQEAKADGRWVRYEDAQAENERLQALADERGGLLTAIGIELQYTEFNDVSKTVREHLFNPDGSVK